MVVYLLAIWLRFNRITRYIFLKEPGENQAFFVCIIKDMNKDQLKILIKEEITKILNEFSSSDFNKAKTWNDFVKLFDQYKRDLTPITKYDEEHSFLGSGANGKVFRIGNSDKVIKITKNVYDVYLAEELLETNYKHLPKIYNTIHYTKGVRKEWSKRSKYAGAIVLEYLTELPKDLFNLFVMLFPNYNKKAPYLDNFLEGLIEIDEIEKILLELDPSVESIIKKYDFLNQLVGIKNDLNAALDMEDIIDSGVLDPTPGNFLMRGNTIVFTDIINS
jgi:hypothetical protein